MSSLTNKSYQAKISIFLSETILCPLEAKLLTHLTAVLLNNNLTGGIRRGDVYKIQLNLRLQNRSCSHLFYAEFWASQTMLMFNLMYNVMIGKERLGKKRLNYICCQGDMSSPQCAEDHENQKLWLLFQHSWKLDPWLHFPSGDSKVKLTWQRQTIGKVLVLQAQNSFLSGTPCWTICLTRMTNRSKIQEWQFIWTVQAAMQRLQHILVCFEDSGERSHIVGISPKRHAP